MARQCRHLLGQHSVSKDFCISYFNSDEKGIGNLDVDDTNSYGPETITITDIGATFTYSVVDFLSEGTLGGSDATVKVYLPGESSAIKFNVPSGSGLVWHVFEYENGEIKRLNDLSNDVDRVGAKR